MNPVIKITRGNKTNCQLILPGNFSADTLYFTAKAKAIDTGVRLIDKVITNKTFASGQTKVIIEFTKAETEALKGIYFYDITSVDNTDTNDVKTVIQGTLIVEGTIRTPLDGIKPTPQNVQVVDVSKLNVGDVLQVQMIDGVKQFTNVPMPSIGTKVYRALITQTGTEAPVATVLENTIGDLVWGRQIAGGYWCYLAGAFPQSKTFCLVGVHEQNFYRLSRSGNDGCTLSSTTSLGDRSDSLLLDTSIEIVVYP